METDPLKALLLDPMPRWQAEIVEALTLRSRRGETLIINSVQMGKTIPTLADVMRRSIRHEALERVLPGRPRDILTKILDRVEIDLETGCWNWTGPTSGENGRGSGYARMCVDGGTMAVHRVVYMLFNGPIPPRKQIDHTCRNRRCVCPAHLDMVTHRENQRRRDQCSQYALGDEGDQAS